MTNAVPPAPRIPTPLTKCEQIYLALLQHWYRHRSDPPSCRDIGEMCSPIRSSGAVRFALISAEGKGYVFRDRNGQFRITRR